MQTNKKNSAFRRTIKLLNAHDRKRLSLLLAAQITISFLDLLGVLLIGFIGAIAISGIQSNKVFGYSEKLINFLGIVDFDFRKQVAILAVIATLFLVLKSIISAYLTKRILRYLSYKGAELSNSMIEKLLMSNLIFIRNRTEKEIIYTLTYGVEEVMIKILGTFSVAVADFSLLILLTIALLMIETTVAISTIIFFLGIALILHKIVTKRMQELGASNARLNIYSSESISKAIFSYRELTVRNQIPNIVEELSKIRKEMAQVQSDLAFMPNIGKYVVETSIIIGALVLSGIQFMISDAVNAISILSVFLASGARIAPAMLRLQQSFAVYRSSTAAANLTLDLAESLKNEEENFSLAISKYNNNFKNFESHISITNLDFSYPESNEFALSDINLDIEQGMFIALVGPSGAGKTSLVDAILGIINPSKGKVLISGLPPRESIKKWPGSIAYVPQDVNIINGTIKENLILGFGANEVPDEEIKAVLLKSNLYEFINRLPNGLNTMTGERGLKLSGGQKQKVAFARALITDPKIIVLDEATSALDAESEKEITNFIVNLKGSKTIIVIAHRLASVQSADKVVYISDGKILATGKFADVRSKIKDFDNQAKIMGL